MNEVALVTREEKLAIVGAIDAQFKAQFGTGLTQYEPLDAQDYLIGTGEFDELEITVKRQFEILKALQADGDEDIEITFFDVVVNDEDRTIVDGLHTVFCLTEESSERDEEIYNIKAMFGNIYIRTSIAGIKRARSRYSGPYSAELIFDDDLVHYQIICSPNIGTCHYHLHDGRPPQKIIKYMQKRAVGERVTKRKLNQELYPDDYNSDNWVLAKDRSLKDHVFVRDKELLLFYDIEASSITRLGNKATNLTFDIIEALKSNCDRFVPAEN